LSTTRGTVIAALVPFWVVPSISTATEIDGSAHLDAKLAALREHRTQVTVDGGFFALADNFGAEAFAVEYFRLARGRLAPTGTGREDDLFAGLVE